MSRGFPDACVLVYCGILLISTRVESLSLDLAPAKTGISTLKSSPPISISPATLTTPVRTPPDTRIASLTLQAGNDCPCPLRDQEAFNATASLSCTAISSVQGSTVTIQMLWSWPWSRPGGKLQPDSTVFHPYRFQTLVPRIGSVDFQSFLDGSLLPGREFDQHGVFIRRSACVEFLQET